MFVEGLEQGKRLAECLSKLRVNAPASDSSPSCKQPHGLAKLRVSWHVLPLSTPKRNKRSYNEPRNGKETICARQLTSGHLCFPKKKSFSKRIKEKRYLGAKKE